MARFKQNKGKESPAISTASLPDIIFMLLFFFMVVTVMRESDLKVKVNTPQASELDKLKRKSIVNTIWVGKPTKQYIPVYGPQPRIQLNDKIEDLTKIPIFLAQHKETVPENDRNAIITSLRVDSDVTMGIVSDIKEKLRKSGQLKVNYSAKPKAE